MGSMSGMLDGKGITAGGRGGGGKMTLFCFAACCALWGSKVVKGCQYSRLTDFGCTLSGFVVLGIA